MNSNEQRQNELIVGYDLCDDYSQISYFNFSLGEPKTVSTTAGEEQFQIPTVISKIQGVDKWFLGEEASMRVGSECFVVKDILNKCRNNEIMIIDNAEYSPAQLLEIFIRKTFIFLSSEGIGSRIPDVIVFTIEEINSNLVQAIHKCAENLGIRKENIFIQDHQESFVEYTLNQKQELWNWNVVLLEYGKDYLKSFNLKINTKTTPVLATIDKEEFINITPLNTLFLTDTVDERNKKTDLLVRDTLKEYFGKAMVSCVLLCGDGFEGDWPKETLRFLCAGRRVFQGKNLYSKGACYKGAGKILSNSIENYLYLGENKLRYNVGLEIISRGTSQYHNLILANENWYDAAGECEVILDNETCIELKLTPIDNKDIRMVIVNLHDIPARPNKTIRLLIQVRFESSSVGRIKIKDLGFGEFYESSGKVWEHEILL